MANVFVVVEKTKDWEPYYKINNLVTFEEYVDKKLSDQGEAFVLNLCRSYKYRSKGYYTSLMAEARGHKVIPNVIAINDLSRKSIYGLQIDDFSTGLAKAFGKLGSGSVNGKSELSLLICFGQTHIQEFSELCWKIFELFPFPILRVQLTFDKKWTVSSVKASSISQLETEEEDLFASALSKYDSKIWKKPRAKKLYRYDLAILHNPDEKLPPSNKGALKRFIKAGKDYNIHAELIERKDLSRVSEYDGLFIRETTSIDHYTYTFARNAQSNQMVVIDSPSSILRCANKVYLHEVLTSLKVKTPQTLLLDEDKAAALIKTEGLTFPLVLKIPDGSFSKGVYKVSNYEEFRQRCDELFEKSVLILAQEYMYTDFDWRIGVLNKKAIFACRYYMTKGHWQIYQHGSNSQVTAGKFDTLSVSKAPKAVLTAALKATSNIGDGLYGVDLKERDGEVYVIEVNDNPNIDHGVEDLYLGEDLYGKIMEEFFRRFEAR